jgi:hypothetical protein
MPTATKTRRPRKSPAEATAARAARSVQIADLSDRLKAFAESVDPDDQAAHEARFDHYSSRNAMLIVMQDPTATVVRGFTAWLAEGRCVRKGERSRIAILAPAGSTGGRVDEAPASVAGETMVEKERRFFRLVPVFDISQTEPIQAPTPSHQPSMI